MIDWLPTVQVAASVAGEFVGSGSSGGQGGIVNTVVDTLAGSGR